MDNLTSKGQGFNMSSAYDQLLNNVSLRLFNIIRSGDYNQLRQILYNDQLHDHSAFSDRDAQELINIFAQNMGAPLNEMNIKNYVGRLARLDDTQATYSNVNNRTVSSQSIPNLDPRSFNGVENANFKSVSVQSSNGNIVRRTSHIEVQNQRPVSNIVERNSHIDSQSQRPMSNYLDRNQTSDNDDKYRRIFMKHDFKNNGRVPVDKIYIAVIEVVQKDPNVIPVPSYNKVSNMISVLYPQASDLSFEDFMRLINVLRESN